MKVPEEKVKEMAARVSKAFKDAYKCDKCGGKGNGTLYFWFKAWYCHPCRKRIKEGL